MRIKYTDEVKAMLKASGMTDTEIGMSEVRANLDSAKILASGPATDPGTLPEKYVSSPLEPIADYSR